LEEGDEPVTDVGVVGGGIKVADHDEPLGVQALADADVFDLQTLVHGLEPALTVS
jgi:hypothetical protein